MSSFAYRPPTEGPYLSPLFRWAGSKRRLLPELIKYVPQSFGWYIEPFSGSACLFFALRPPAAILSDINAELMHAYRVLKTHPMRLHRVVSRMPSSDAFYYELREQSAGAGDEVAKAARFVYLNRHCFNGVYRTNRQGEFNVPRGTKLGAVPDERLFVRCAKALEAAELITGDFESAAVRAVQGDFVYLDPPYAKIGSRRRGEYGYSSFDTPDLERLAQCLKALDDRGATFLLSYADCAEIRQIKASWHARTLFVRRHVAGFHRHRALVREILVSNRRL
jgi:DNA adenine methylase